MQDILSQVRSLKRPQILVRAARFGLDDYIRDRHLPRCLKMERPISPGRALLALLDIEKQLNSERTTKTGSYDIARHVDVMIAIMGETQAFQATARPQVALV